MISNTEIRGSTTAASFFDLMPVARAAAGIADGQPIPIAPLAGDLISFVTPSVIEYYNFFLQVNLDGVNASGTISVYGSNDGIKTDTALATKTTTAGTMAAGLNISNVGSKFLVIEITAITSGTISSILLNCKR